MNRKFLTDLEQLNEISRDQNETIDLYEVLAFVVVLTGKLVPNSHLAENEFSPWFKPLSHCSGKVVSNSDRRATTPST
jgi:hypothetical protein